MTSSTKATGSARRRARPRVLGIAIACALLAVAVAIPVASDAVRAKKLGHTKHTPKPQCPANCEAIGSVTGFQVKADGRSGLFVMPQNGKIVAWSVDMSRPRPKQRDFFKGLFHSKFHGDPSARISILKRVDRRHFKLRTQSRAVNLAQYFGHQPVITLKRPLGAPRGTVVALTTPTWVPSLASHHPGSDEWRASRQRDKCTAAQSAHARPQQKKGSIRQYGCRFNARLLYWVYYRPK
jgi:hypothetical protein